MKALILHAEQRTANVKSVSDPIPTPNELLIQVEAVALNPVDSLYMFQPLGTTGRVMGSDFAGTIRALGDAVPPESMLKPGNRVAGFLQGACSVNDRPGAFAELLSVPWDLVWMVRDEMRPEDAVVISLCGLTAAQALFYRMGLQAPFPWRSTMNIGQQGRRQDPLKTLIFFVYGASTSVGMYAAQLIQQFAAHQRRTIKLFGTASTKHFSMLKSEPYCFNELVDYRNCDWPAKIMELINGAGVDYAYDCISEDLTVSDTATTLAASGKIAVVRSREGGAWTAPNLTVEPSYGAVWEGLGEEVQYQGMSLPASLEAKDFTAAFYRWLSEGRRLKSNPIREMPGGLENIVGDGFRLLGSGKMGDRETQRNEAWMKPLSAQKMVYKITNLLITSISNSSSSLVQISELN